MALDIAQAGDALPADGWKKIRNDAGETFKRAVEAWGLPADRAAITVKEFCAWAGISRSTFYNLVAAHELKVRKIGNRTVVLCSDAVVWLQALPETRAEQFAPAEWSGLTASAGTEF